MLKLLSNQAKLFSFYLSELDTFIPLSARVDLLLFILGIKSCLRTKLKTSFKCGLDFPHFAHPCGYFYVANSEKLLKKILRIDHSLSSHEKDFGILLGYPKCCCEKIAEVGEMEIDAYEEALLKQTFLPPFQLINTAKYKIGKAFISHIPCSTTCQNSLEQALRVKSFVLENKNEKALKPWLEEIREIDG